ncbi:MAG: DUF362 domain-containing protein [candidate division WOR-3 bacterium]|nr:DUF362 domain-containing protein [candidate division WOR-3 bacterium]
MERISRREFLKISAGFAVSLALPLKLSAEEKHKISGPLIGVARGEKNKLVKAAVDAIGGMDKFIKPGDRVLIKPNISFSANAECGATTSSEVIKQVVELCLDAGASKITIIDYPLANPDLCIERSGVRQAIVDKNRVNLLMLSKERQFVEIEVPDGKELKTVKIARELQKADKFINLPTAKSHSATGVSLGIKNLMGLIWDRSYLHRVDLHRAIAELGLIMKPDLTIVDATRVLTSGGPGGPGKTVILNTVIAGADMVAVDSYTVGISSWYNKSFTGKNVKYILYASELGLGEIDTEKMVIKEVKV